MVPVATSGIGKHPFFSGWQEQDVAQLCESAREMEVEPNEIIFDIGDEELGMFLLLDGEVSLLGKIDGVLHEVDRRAAPDAFGEVSLITGEPHKMRAVAVTQCHIGFIPASAVEQHMGHIPKPINLLLKSLVKHIGKTSAISVEKAFRQERMATIGAMVNNIVHDFKSPFQMITLGAETIDSISRDKQVQRLCVSITEQVTRMLKLSSELSEYSKGQMAYNFEPVNLRAFMNGVREANDILIKKKAVNLSIDAPDAEAEIETRSMHRVFQNLISNSVDAIGDKGGLIDICITMPDTGHITITYADNGGGIPEKIQPRFWEPFVTYGKRNGTGLGTAIVKSVIEGHGGTIDFKSEKGKGTLFTIKLPLFHILEGA